MLTHQKDDIFGLSWEKIIRKHPSASVGLGSQPEVKKSLARCVPSVQYAGYTDTNCVASADNAKLLLIGTATGEVHLVDASSGTHVLLRCYFG